MLISANKSILHNSIINRLGEKDPNTNHLLRKDNKLKDILLGVPMLENLPWIKTSMFERSDMTKITQNH